MRRLITITYNSRILESGELTVTSECLKIRDCIYSRLPEVIIEDVANSFFKLSAFLFNKDSTLVSKVQFEMTAKSTIEN